MFFFKDPEIDERILDVLNIRGTMAANDVDALESVDEPYQRLLGLLMASNWDTTALDDVKSSMNLYYHRFLQAKNEREKSVRSK